MKLNAIFGSKFLPAIIPETIPGPGAYRTEEVMYWIQSIKFDKFNVSTHFSFGCAVYQWCLRVRV